MRMFDTIVIGKGLIGSAAARYLSTSGSKVAIIGPDEPLDNEQAMVFASHYDQARIQRLIGKDEIWTNLNVTSVQQYNLLQKQSGINFHNSSGCLYVNPYGTDQYLSNATSLAGKFGISCKLFIDEKALSKEFPFFSFPTGSCGLFEPTPSGFINPRLLLQAQLAVFKKSQGTIFKETACKISKNDNFYSVETVEGNTWRANNVLVAGGAFVNFMDLLPDKLELQIKSEIVLLGEVSKAESIRLGRLPSLLYEVNTKQSEGVYLIQPVKYPDGNYYIKLGCNMDEDIFFDSLSQVQEWFRKGNSDQFIERLKTILNELIPGIACNGYTTKRCIISRSVHGRPYIGETNQRGLFVVSGCNGYSAMCADNIGSIAAKLVSTGEWMEPYSAEDFRLCYG